MYIVFISIPVSLFNPKEYTGSRYVHSDQEIIKKLKDEKLK